MDPQSNPMSSTDASQTNPGQADPQPMGSVPPPPPMEVHVRTMQSDTTSMQTQGGAAPTPEVFTPSNGGLGDGAPVFKMEEASAMPPSGGGKKWVWILLLLIIIAGGAGGAYYYYFMMSGQSPPIATTPPPPPPPSPPAGGPPTASSTTAAVIDFTAINEALKTEALKTQPADTLTEVVLATEQGTPIPFSKFITAILPDMAANTDMITFFRDTFKDSFATYLYYDTNGVWPIYKATLKDTVTMDAVALKQKLSALELSPSFTNFYITSPGAPGTFRDGQVNTYPTRYASFAQPGASFNYAIIGSDVVMSTSYQGLKKLLTK